MGEYSTELGLTLQRASLYLKTINMLVLRPCSTYSNKKQSVPNKLNKLKVNLKSSRLSLTKKIKLIQ